MDAQTLKLTLIQKLLATDNVQVLQSIDSFLDAQTTGDWWHELSEPAQNHLKRSMEQAKNGETVSSEKVDLLFDAQPHEDSMEGLSKIEKSYLDDSLAQGLKGNTVSNAEVHRRANELLGG